MARAIPEGRPGGSALAPITPTTNLLSTVSQRPDQPSAARATPVVVGLCGGVGSGKSTVAAMLEDHGARVLDADAAARACFREEAVRAELLGRFGPKIVGDDGLIDRALIAEAVFGPQGTEDREWLEALIHPRVRALLRTELDRLSASDPSPWCCVLDVPLLVEGPLAAWCDRIVFIETSPATRQGRTVATRGWSEDEVGRRERAQASLEDKRARADHILTNDGSLAALTDAVATLVADLKLERQNETPPTNHPSPGDAHSPVPPASGGS